MTPMKAKAMTRCILFLLVFALAPMVGAQTLTEADNALSSGDFGRAASILQELAKSGNIKAQVELGLMYSNGKGVEKSNAQASAWWQKAADAGNARAHMLLAYSYRGYGESIDKDKCLFHFQKAAESGEPKAMEELAVAYSEGEAILPGLAKDQVEALKWYLIDPAAKSPKDPQVIVFDRTRDRLRKGLTATELAEAKDRAEAWLAKHPHLKTWGLRADPVPPEKQSPEEKQIYEILQNDSSPGPE